MKLISGRKPDNCTGADIVKIATTATEIVDVAKMFQILVHCQVI
jgi:3-dehydroquinate dehydratase / shikimate dehydrogenase